MKVAFHTSYIRYHNLLWFTELEPGAEEEKSYPYEDKRRQSMELAYTGIKIGFVMPKLTPKRQKDDFFSVAKRVKYLSHCHHSIMKSKLLLPAA